MEFTVKENRLIKARNRLNRLQQQRAQYTEYDPKWQGLTSLINIEKDIINDLKVDVSPISNRGVNLCNPA